MAKTLTFLLVAIVVGSFLLVADCLPSKTSVISRGLLRTNSGSGDEESNEDGSGNEKSTEDGSGEEENQMMDLEMRNQKNAPKKPLSAYFLFSQEERLKVKAENPDYSITEVAKELGRRWATLNPTLKQSYEQRYQDARKVYDQEMNHYKPQKKKKDPNAPKQPLSAYFIFSTEERLKVKHENPNFSISEVAKELGRRWADMDPVVKQRYQARAEEERQKYDVDMASYRQGTFAAGQERVGGQGSPVNMNQHPSPAPSPSYGVQQQQQTQDYTNLLQ